jgi:hypothetical protein
MAKQELKKVTGNMTRTYLDLIEEKDRRKSKGAFYE